MDSIAKFSRNLFIVCAVAALLSGCASNRAPTARYSGELGAIATSNPELLAAQERQYQAHQQKIIATSEMMPQVTLNASTTAHVVDDLAPVSRGSANDYGIGLTWPILRSIAAIKGVRAAHSNIQAADAAVRVKENKLLVNIVSAIANYERASTVAALRVNRTSRLQSYLSNQKKRYSLGRISRTDLRQIEGRIATAQGARAQANAEKAGAVAQLASFGLTPQHGIKLASPAAHVPATEAEAIAIAHRNNPAERESAYKVAAAEDNVAKAAFGLLPELNLGVTAGQSATYYSNASSVVTGNVAIRLGLSVPIFDGGRQRAALSVQESQVREMQYQARGVSVNIETSIRSVWHRYRAAISSVIYAQNRYAIAKRALGGVREALKVGARSISDELSAMDEVSEAQVSLASAHYNVQVFGHQLMAYVDRIAIAYKLTAIR